MSEATKEQRVDNIGKRKSDKIQLKNHFTGWIQNYSESFPALARIADFAKCGIGAWSTHRR